MVEITGRYAGDLRVNATHGPSGATLSCDAPVDHEGLGRSFSPTDLVATALGSCVLTTMGIVARRHEWPMEGARAVVHKHMVTKPIRRIGRLEVRIALAAMRSRIDEIRLNVPSSALRWRRGTGIHGVYELPVELFGT